MLVKLWQSSVRCVKISRVPGKNRGSSHQSTHGFSRAHWHPEAIQQQRVVGRDSALRIQCMANGDGGQIPLRSRTCMKDMLPSCRVDVRMQVTSEPRVEPTSSSWLNTADQREPDGLSFLQGQQDQRCESGCRLDPRACQKSEALCSSTAFSLPEAFCQIGAWRKKLRLSARARQEGFA